MTKKAPDTSTTVADDVKSFLEQSSDFGFEVATLKVLRDLNFRTLHSGTYTDQVSGKIRQFDIRAEALVNEGLHAHLAVECKNLREASPLVISRIPRKAEESFDNLIYIPSSQKALTQHFPGHGFHTDRFVLRRESGEGIYTRYDYVGKNAAQIFKNGKNEVSGKDSEVFEKYTQSLASAHAMLVELESRARMPSDQLHAILPLVVVPDKTLWVADYDSSGLLKSHEQVTNAVSPEFWPLGTSNVRC